VDSIPVDLSVPYVSRLAAYPKRFHRFRCPLPYVSRHRTKRSFPIENFLDSILKLVFAAQNEDRFPTR
jgi:hypothetical protein